MRLGCTSGQEDASTLRALSPSASVAVACNVLSPEQDPQHPSKNTVRS